MTRTFTRTEELFTAAQKVIPGGVNSPVRAFRGVGGTPLFVERAAGPHFWDVDGNRYIDYVLSWGPLILGHAHPDVVEALVKQVALGTSYGTPTELETELAEQVIKMMPGLEQVRFVNSGTEATMSALRLARAHTERMKIVKFNGCYHGHADMLLVQAGSGVATLGLPDSPGVPASSTSHTLVAEYNDLESVRALFKDHADDIAAHMFAFYFGVVSTITPPVALAAFAAAAIAGTRPMATAFESTRVGIAKYLMPLAFVYNPALLWIGPLWLTLISATLAMAAMWVLSVGLEGWRGGPIGPLRRASCVTGAIGMLCPPTGTVLGAPGWALVAGGLALAAAGFYAPGRPAVGAEAARARAGRGG